jgi:nucleotide-binding universal stress UspA family protein
MPMEIRHILIPTDFSAPAIQAVTAAFELAQIFGAKLSLLHVIEVPAYAIEVALPLENLERDARREWRSCFQRRKPPTWT